MFPSRDDQMKTRGAAKVIKGLTQKRNRSKKDITFRLALSFASPFQQSSTIAKAPEKQQQRRAHVFLIECFHHYNILYFGRVAISFLKLAKTTLSFYLFPSVACKTPQRMDNNARDRRFVLKMFHFSKLGNDGG